MKIWNFPAVLIISATGCMLIFLSFIFAMPVLAQGHAGHTAQPPAVDKQKTVKSQNILIRQDQFLREFQVKYRRSVYF